MSITEPILRPLSLVREKGQYVTGLASLGLVRTEFHSQFCQLLLCNLEKKNHFPPELNFFNPLCKEGVIILAFISLGLNEIMEQSTWHIVNTHLSTNAQ